MDNFKRRKLALTCLLPIIFFAASWPIFWKIYKTSKVIVDEEFHLRQGLNFCRMRFNVWDSKITTFPGLYFIAVLMRPFSMCNILGLRMISLIAATINVILFFKIRLRVAQVNESAIDAITLACLPPLYFFSHLYYTDTVALMFVLLFYYNWLKESRLYSAVFGAASVLMRQTNIVWIAMTVCITALNRLISNYEKKKSLPFKASLYKFKVWCGILTSIDVIIASAWQTIVRCSLSILIIMPFILFVILNGSIVVGDKQAHKATLHLTQLLYFGLFTLIFAISNTIRHGETVLRSLWRKKLLSAVILIILILIVKWNTLVHPYLLADNRHYTFYLWNRFYGRYNWFKYAMAPVYLFALALMVRSLQECRDYFQIAFWIAVFIVLCFQRLLEVRYFLIPYVLLRLHMDTNRPLSIQLVELAMYMAINAVTLYIFFTKEIFWKDYIHPQRLLW